MSMGLAHGELARDQGLQLGWLLAVVMRAILLIMVLLAKEGGKRSSMANAATSNMSIFPAMFVFGDSLLDPGNGAHLEATSLASRLHITGANHPPYGRDLPSHLPSGRYSNGLVVSDILALLIGLPCPPAYLLERDNIMKGTSFAAVGAAILNQTGLYPLPRLNFYDQVGLFVEVRQKLVSSMGESNANKLISKSLFLTWMGANDYYLSYNSNPLGQSSAQKKYSPSEFRRVLISSYRDYIVTLYGNGARKFAIVSLPPLGCSPIVQLLFQRKNETCISFINKEAQDFNADLLNMSKNLQATYADGHFTILNTYDVSIDAMTHPSIYGFLSGVQPCCATGPYGGVPICETHISSICEDASKYIFWDFAHPSQAGDSLLVNRFWTGSSPDVQPINIQELSKL